MSWIRAIDERPPEELPIVVTTEEWIANFMKVRPYMCYDIGHYNAFFDAIIVGNNLAIYRVKEVSGMYWMPIPELQIT